jgi:Putative porin
MVVKLVPFYVILLASVLTGASVQAQNPFKTGRMPGGGGRPMSGSSGDSIKFEKRNFSDDSVNIRYRFLDTARFRAFDNSISDYFNKVALDPDDIHLGNNGTAARSLFFTPNMNPGWDPGFHGFDVYSFSINDTRFMTTTKPFTQLTYLLGSKAEQNIGVVHSQNIKPDWNFVFEYRLLNAPGFFNSQNTNHKNFRFNTNYISKDRRYNIFFIVMNNSLQSAENGGIVSDTFLVNKNPAFNDFFNIPTNLAQVPFASRDLFNVKLLTGNKYSNTAILIRNQYDFGKKDSVTTDSTVTRFFLPKLRFEYTLKYQTYHYLFQDVQGSADSAFYAEHYEGLIEPADTLYFKQKWSELVNDFSIIQFPDSKNPLQFLKIGASFQNLSGKFAQGTDNFYNMRVHGEYRNRTKNRKWDMLLFGEFYLIGRNSGDYSLHANLKRNLGLKWGYLETGFRNTNRTPSYLLSHATGFPVSINTGLNKENISEIYGSVENPQRKFRLSANYYLISNYAYLVNFNRVNQESSLFNLLRVGASKEFSLRNHWKWYLDVYLQTVTGRPPVNVPLLYTRNRFAYEGSLFKNLLLSSGFDIRYHTPYDASNYSPVLGQFFYQDKLQLVLRPDIAAYVNFRIRNFTGFTRFENLNTLTFINGFGFKKSNQEIALYPYPGLLFRLGVVWDMIN